MKYDDSDLYSIQTIEINDNLPSHYSIRFYHYTDCDGNTKMAQLKKFIYQTNQRDCLLQ